jgi:hypothetical protein
MAGQLVSTLIFDNYGLLGATQATATGLRITGTLLALLATVIASFNKQSNNVTKADDVPIATASTDQSSTASNNAAVEVELQVIRSE